MFSFGELDAAAVLRLELLQDRLDGLARAAPRRPEVEDDGSVGLQDVVLERGIGDFEHELRVARLRA